MASAKNNVLKVACLALATIGATSFVITLATTGTVYAKNAEYGGKSNKPGNTRGSKASDGRENSAAQEAGVLFQTSANLLIT